MIGEECLVVETDQHTVYWFVFFNLVFDFDDHLVGVEFLLALLHILLTLLHLQPDCSQFKLLDLQFVVVLHHQLPVVLGLPHLLNQTKTIRVGFELFEGGLLQRQGHLVLVQSCSLGIQLVKGFR